MKNYLRPWATGTVATLGAASLFGSAQAQTAITGWGLESGSQGGWTLSDTGNGSFTVGGAAVPSGNTVFRADFSAVTLNIGDSLNYSGSLNFTSGSFAGGLFRIGFVDYTTPGTLSGGVWTGQNQSALGYMLGIPTGGAGIGGANPSEVTGHNGGGAWFSSNNGYSVPGGANNNPANATANTYQFSFTLTRTGANALTIGYSLSDVGAGGTYTETGTATDTGLSTGGTIATPTFNALGFFVNGSDTATSYAFSGITETITPAPEPSTFALLGIGSVVGAFFIRRKKA